MKIDKRRYLHGTCRVCKTAISIEAGDQDSDQMRESLRNRKPYKCTGGGVTPHLEMAAMLIGYDWNFELFEAEALVSDEAFLNQLRDKHPNVLCGERGSFPDLPILHDIQGLEQVGSGDFANNEFYFRRVESPTGTLFYVREKKKND